MNIPMQAQVLKKVFEKVFDEIREQLDLTMNEIIVLLYLESNKNKNTAKDIVEDSLIAKSHVSKSVDSLVNKNLIIRVPDEENKKIIHLELNENAEKIMDELSKKEEEMKALVLKGIPEENIKILEEALEQVKQNIKEFINF